MGFLQHYFRTTLCKLAVWHRLNPNLQNGRLFDCRSCTNIKIDHFSSKKKLSSGPKNFEKNRFFGVFRQYFSKTLLKFAVLLQLSSKLQVCRLFDCRRCASIKNGHVSESKLSFWPKNLEKTCFFKVFRYYFRKTLRKFAVKLRLRLNFQGSRLNDCKMCAKNKIGHFFKNKLSFWPKNLEKTGFWGLPTFLQENASQICCIDPIELKLTG